MTDRLDPFRQHRQATGALESHVGADEFVMVLRYEDLKDITRDWDTYTSDAPFRVPIPSEHNVRAVRQLPIETDPPDHSEYRRVVQETFGRETSQSIRPRVRSIVATLLDAALENGKMEAVRSFALPIQSRALALMLGRSQDEANEWISWRHARLSRLR